MDEAVANSGGAGRLAMGMLVGVIVAAAGWCLFGYYVVAANTSLAIVSVLGLVLVVAAAGVGAGGAMRLIAGSPSRAAGWWACAAAIMGALIGDFLWTWWFTGKPVSVLLGSELTATINTMANLQKLIMYAIAGYVAYVVGRVG